ncbi:MAG: YkgJ family cysteine cluster protein [Armatimonadota bacterium]|nr:YkgJ family cysteine cluster protein [Armatimonadota bacterium]
MRQTFARLPTADCEGCHGCASRCVGNLRITRTEFEAIGDYLGGGMYFPAARTNAQMVVPCEFSEPDGPHCVIYPVRPLICRLFGIVPWLPCPLGRALPTVPDAAEIMQQYQQFERHSFRQWLRCGPSRGTVLAPDAATRTGRMQTSRHGNS